MSKIEIGMMVKANTRHWLRAGQVGSIQQFDGTKPNQWYVVFERVYLGGGIDGEGLWLSEDQFEVLGSGLL